MTLADIAYRTARVQAGARNIVTLDIERLPGTATVQHRGLTITGEFWDLSGWKHVIGRRIHADDVTSWPRTICAAWKWYGAKRVEFAAEWLDGEGEHMLRTIWDVYDRAEIVVGHNLDGFDTKHLRTGWLELGLPLPSPYKTVDTLKVARKELGAESKTLDALCRRFEIPAKSGKYSAVTARAACEGNRAAQREIRAYNVGDIHATEALYDRLRGWIPNHPHALEGTADDRPTCNQCRGSNLARNGVKLAQQITYVLWRCEDCGANVQGTRHSRSAVTRGAA